MTTISIQTFRKAIEDGIDLRTESGLSGLRLLRQLQEQNQLSPALAKRLEVIEKGLDESAQKLMGYLTEGSDLDPARVEDRILENFRKLDRGTQAKLADALYPEEEAKKIKQQLAGSDEARAMALEQIGRRIIEAAGDYRSLGRVLSVWVTDPRKSHLAADFKLEMDKLLGLQSEASALFKEEYRRLLAAQRPPLMRSFEEGGPIGSKVGYKDEGGIRRGRTATEVAESDSGTSAQTVPITQAHAETLLRTLEQRLASLKEDINDGRWKLENTPADQSYDLGVALHRQERDADNLRAQIASARARCGQLTSTD